MGKVLSEAEVDAFRRDGFHSPIKAITADEAQTYRRALEDFERENQGPLKGPQRFKSHLLFKWVANLVRTPAILDAVEDLIGPDILCWTTNWWIKDAKSPSFVSWHQDSHYWGLDVENLVTAWVALSPATIESGCMRLLAGSHRGPGLEHRDTFHDDNMLTRGQEIVEQVDESAAINLEVNTGEAALFTYRIAHASHPNRSDDRRIALAIRYIPPDARQVMSEWDSATLVRGRDGCGNFELEPEPSCDFDPIAVEFHKKADEAQRAILYRGTEWQDHRT